jgi:serine/threonine-protein kinase
MPSHAPAASCERSAQSDTIRGVDPALAPTTNFGPFVAGERIAQRYEITGLLGEGGMGAVYRAHDRVLDEEIALKVLRAELSGSEEALARFIREVKLARRVTHENVARTYDLGSHEHTRFITMELIAGESLSAAAGRGMSLPDALRVAHEACRGLVAAHAVGVVHRDLKPDNVMLADKRVKLTDFGIARALGVADANTKNAIIGTPAYMAPEQVEGHVIDGRTDIYALGVMLFELVTRRLPFQGESAVALAAARLVTSAPNARDVSPEVPEGVSVLIARMLTRKREERPDASTVADELERLRGMRARTTASGVTTLSLADVPLADSRRVLLKKFEGEPADVATALESVLGDTLAGSKGITVARERASKDAAGEIAIEGNVRASGTAVRARVRLVDPARGVTAWAEQIDGNAADPFALEDAMVARVVPAILQRCGASQGPSDAAARALWEEARGYYGQVAPEKVKKATAILEEQLTQHPNDPWVMALLALCIMRTLTQLGAAQLDVAARAEELALRAIDIDPHVADAYYAVALVRWMSGDYRSVLQSLQETLRRNPLLSDAHAGLASILCDIGQMSEALQRVDLAIRLNPRDFNARATRMRTLALMGRKEEARREIERCYELGGGAGITNLECRLVFWWGDRDRAGALADRMEAFAANATWDTAIPALRAFGRGESDPTARGRIDTLLAHTDGSFHSLVSQIATEYYAVVGDRELALQYLVRANARAFWALTWLDHCPALDSIRDAPELAAVRARTAERIAQLTS